MMPSELADTRTRKFLEPEKIEPGTYNKFTFAAKYPKFYAELIKAGMPAIGDGRAVLIQVGK